MVFLNLNKKQWKVIGVGIPGAFALGLLSWFYPIIFNSYDKIHRIYLSEVFAACIAITIFVIRKKTGTKELDNYELLLIIFMGAIAAINLIPADSFDANTIIIISTIILVAWFVYFGLWRYIAEDKTIEKGTFITMVSIFIGLVAIIMVGFNIHRVVQLWTPG